ALTCTSTIGCHEGIGRPGLACVGSVGAVQRLWTGRGERRKPKLGATRPFRLLCPFALMVAELLRCRGQARRSATMRKNGKALFLHCSRPLAAGRRRLHA